MLADTREETNQGTVGEDNSKESSMLDLNNNKESKDEIVSLKSLSDLTGFPIEMIKKELFDGSEIKENDMSLEELRLAMMSYIDKTMLDNSKK